MPTQRGFPDAPNTPTWRARTRPFNTSAQGALPHPRPAPTLRTSSHHSPERMPARQEDTGRDDPRGGHSNITYASALRRVTGEETQTIQNNHRSYNSGFENRSRTYSPHNYTHTPGYDRREAYISNTQYDESSHSHSYNSQYYSRRNVGCFNCGEFNHVQRNCRFDHKVLCTICQRVGHKSRLCQHYTT